MPEIILIENLETYFLLHLTPEITDVDFISPILHEQSRWLHIASPEMSSGKI